MKIVSFNVNSVRLRIHQIAAVVDRHAPDVIGLQETKVVDDEFPHAALQELGFEAAAFGQKTHYGVALLSRTPLQQVRMGFDHDGDQAQKRLISATINTGNGPSVRVINGYFPQGESRHHDTKFPAKREFYQHLRDDLDEHHSPDEPLIVMGDLNVAPQDIDIGIGAEGMKRWLRSGSCSFLPEEREWFQTLQAWGLEDSYRLCHASRDDQFSWFDYRSKGFDRDPKRGLRIDHILCSRPLRETVTDAGIDYEVRGMDKPSDHCPIWTTFTF